MTKKRKPDDFYCRKGHVMPDDLSETEQRRWTHKDTEVVYVGSYFKTIECKHCGTQLKAQII